MSAPQLVILAAGLGRRFGGLKQLTAVGPDGAAIMDYTVHDALSEGFGEVVLVVRREIEDQIRAHAEAGFARRVSVRYVNQELDDIPGDVPAGRTRPWGTVQAVLAASGVVAGPFAVANADDYYGRPALTALAHHLRTRSTWCMVGYRAADTLPSEGAVSRGLVHADDGLLQSIREVHTLRRHGRDAVWDAPEGPCVIPGSSLVSMNLWGFGPEAMDVLSRRFGAFLAAGPGPDAECYLPEAVGAAVREGQALVEVLDARSPWCGVTATADLAAVQATIVSLIEAGHYPERLWD